jgi:hypothetical protein
MPLVSVVVPTYRRPERLAVALDSVRAQTLRDFEVLVCDNAAQGQVAALVASLDDPRFTHVPRPRNLGMVENALDGFARATGELVMKLDDDDELHPSCLERLVAPFEGHPEIVLAASDFDVIDAGGRPWEEAHDELAALTGRDRAPAGCHRPFTALAARGTIHLVSALVRRSAVDWAAVDRRCGPSYDLHIALLAAADAATAHYDRSRLAAYRVHATSDTFAAPVGQLEGALFALRAALDGGRHTDVEVLEQQVDATAVRLARALLRTGQAARAREVLRDLPGPRWDRLRLEVLSRAPSGLGSVLTSARGRAAGRGRVAGPRPTA